MIRDFWLSGWQSAALAVPDSVRAKIGASELHFGKRHASQQPTLSPAVLIFTIFTSCIRRPRTSPRFNASKRTRRSQYTSTSQEQHPKFPELYPDGFHLASTVPSRWFWKQRC